MMDLKHENKLVRETIAYPVRYDEYQQTIWDAKGRMVCDIKGWESIQMKKRSGESQDSIGEKVAKLLNEFKDSERQNSRDDRAVVSPVKEKEVCFN